MDAARIQDRIQWGNNVAARWLGRQTDAYRPRGSDSPLAGVNRYLRLHASFRPATGGYRQAGGYGNALWHGIFDAAYTRCGDYLVQNDMIWFIASQHDMLPVLCVRTNRTVSLSRPATPSAAGTNAYGGIMATNALPLMTNWPASVLGTSGSGLPQAGLPNDISVPYWTVLMPALPDVAIVPSDVLSDEIGRNAVVSATELSELGWRLTVKQMTT